MPPNDKVPPPTQTVVNITINDKNKDKGDKKKLSVAEEKSADKIQDLISSSMKEITIEAPTDEGPPGSLLFKKPDITGGSNKPNILEKQQIKTVKFN